MSRNPNNCPSCDSPLVDGTCQLCAELENINSAISPEPVIETAKQVWNWEKFFELVANNEIAITGQSSDEQIQNRINALQELDKQTELLRQSIRIRISVDSTELEARGKKPRKLAPSKMAEFNDVLPKISKAPQSKVEKLKASLNGLGIDFDKFTKDLDI